MRIVAMACAGALLAAGAMAGTAVAAWQDGAFSYDPVPRWTYDAKSNLDLFSRVCPVLQQECPQLNADEFEVNVVYDELYNASGKLSGLRMIKGTGCRPLDEALLIGQREFRAKFEEEGQSDVDGVTLELGEGVDPAKVRIVKRIDNFQFSAGCA